MRTYLVGRKNSSQPCDIELPVVEASVSRRHLEISITDEGRIYIVHLHPRNTTAVFRGGSWQAVTQEFVDLDEPLLLGKYETTVRGLLALTAQPMPDRAPSARGGVGMEWDPERGTFLHRR
jgi:hypothetical protein